MSELKDICVSLETAKTLLYSPINIITEFYWYKPNYSKELNIKCEWNICDHKNMLGWSYAEIENCQYEFYPAPTNEELERYITKDYSNYNIKLNSHYNEGKTMIEFFNLYHANQLYLKSKWHEKKSDALAEILIKLERRS